MGIDNVEDLGARVQYVASAAQTDFDYPFAIFTDADLVVDIDGTTKALSTDYTVSGAGDDTGGTVTLLSAATGGEIVTIYRDIAIERLTDIQQNGPWSSTAYNDEQDKTYLLLQQLDERCDRSLRIPITAEVADADIELAPANYASKYLTFDSDGKPTPAVLSDATMTQAIVGNLLFPRTAAEIAAGVIPTYYYYEPGDVRRYGAVGDGVTNDYTAISNALLVSASHPTKIPQLTFLCNSALTVPDYGYVYGFGRDSLIKKGFNGDLITLGRHGKIKDLRIDGQNGTYTGRGVLISAGVNSATLTLQGHQLVENCIVDNCTGYPIEYTAAGVGWMSNVINCQFSGYSSDAAIKWPDETTTGGNRAVLKCYSADALVNVGGCDNGIISDNTSGSAAGANAAILFPAGTTNRAKKVIVTNNRLANAAGTVTVRGTDHIFSHNEIAGSVTFASNAASDGAANCTYADNRIVGTFTDSSATANYIIIDTPVAFTPTWASSGTAVDIGNADVRCEYTRHHGNVRAKYWITFGSTTTFGTGTYTFTLPIARYVALTTNFVGSAYLKARGGIAATLFGTGDVLTCYDSSGNQLAATSPVTWASGDVIIIDIVYRIHS